ncbi:unnamed protein product [Gordionus sp. m RMFG-2023]|uniref:proteasome subunit alpha type-4-like n=1 Tax=Gordionus sp. m RMFG-2023 TaxID=3053472 RepID=UPI0030E42231
MSRRYDTRTTIFSPEGRLYQVEYAMEAITQAGICLGILTNEGILLAAEQRNINKLLDEMHFSEKIFKIDEDIACAVAGITSDANVLIDELRLIAQRYRLQWDGPIPCEQLVRWLCDIKQAYTQYGGKRPFGISILYMGWDKHYGYQLYQSDPSGNYSGWKATCTGNNSAAAMSILKQDYTEGEMTLDKAMELTMKVLHKTFDANKITPDKIEIATLTRDSQLQKSIIKVLTKKEIGGAIEKYEKSVNLAATASKAAADSEKKKQDKEASTSKDPKTASPSTLLPDKGGPGYNN